MKKSESGRTLVETLATLAVIGVLSVGAVKIYNYLTTKVKAQNTAKMIKTLALERQNTAMRSSTGGEMTVKGPHSSLKVKNGVAGNHQPYFWVETSLSDSAFCKALKESDLIQADLIEVDGVANGTCTDNSKIAFYFKKNVMATAYCPENSTNCDSYGDATECEEGYYLDGGKCSACGEHVATCEDEYTPLTCMDGYNLYGTICSETAPCTVDSDCDVCGECGQDGYCSTMCSIPKPDANNDCGENECMVYDNATQSCRYACERKEYLESTGTQYIDTGVGNNLNVKMNFNIKPSSAVGAYFMGVDGGIVFGTNDGVHFRALGKNSVNFFNTNNFYNIEMYYSNNARFCVIDRTETLSNNIGTFYNSNVYILAASGASAVSYYLPWSIKDCKMWNNETLVRDFIPVISPVESKCGGKPAMFDRVTEKLFCNEGSGEFLTD